MNLKETKIGHHFQQRNNQFIWIIIVFIFTAGMSWALMKTNIKDNAEYGVETRIVINAHLEDVANDPVTDAQIQRAVSDNTKNIGTNLTKITSVSDLQIQAMANQTNLVKISDTNSKALTKLAEDVGRIKGKLDIE